MKTANIKKKVIIEYKYFLQRVTVVALRREGMRVLV